MTESDVRVALETLAKDALQRVGEAGEGLQRYKSGIAFFDQERDELFTQLPSFATAITQLNALPLVGAQCGPGGSTRLVLQFIYGLCNALESPFFDDAVFERVWASFREELSRTKWKYVGVSNLQNFHSETLMLELGDGVTIRARSFKELGILLQWDERRLDLIAQDWQQGAFGSYVMFVEQQVSKTPDNFILANDPNLWTKAQRALLALRLFKPGDVRMGRMFFSRPAAFNVGLGGVTWAGFSAWHPGKEYRLEASEVPSVRELYELLSRFEAGDRKNLQSIDLALRRFSSTFERYLHQAEDRILDAITALEALLGESTEIAFKLAFRTSGLLAGDDREWVAIFDRMKTFYETRNRIVHGAMLKEKHRKAIQDPEDLIDILRRLLAGFLRFAESGSFQPESFRAQLDTALQHSQRRAELRERMGLVHA